MRKKGLLKLVVPISLIVVLAVGLPLMSGCRPAVAPPEVAPPEVAPPEVAPPEVAPPEEVAPPKTINVGFCMALSGPEAGWGLPGLTCNTIWVDEVNAAGGLQVGDERYLINIVAWDDEGIGSLALQGFRKLILEDNCAFISTIGGAPSDATQPFATEHKVIAAPLAGMDVSRDRPYLIGGTDANPRGDVMRPVTIAIRHPEVKTVAMVGHDDPICHVGFCWEKAGWEAMGVEVIYEAFYGLETTDFAPVMSAMMATDPDCLSFNISYPEFDTALWEQAYLQGWDPAKPLTSNYFDTEATLALVPVEFMENGYEGYPWFDDPWFAKHPDEFYAGLHPNDLYDMWMERYGPGGPEDQYRLMTGIDWLHLPGLQVWCAGAELAGTVEDNDAIMRAVKSVESFNTLLGPTKWFGTEVWGLDNCFVPPIYTVKITNGEKRIVAEWDWWEDFWNEHGQLVIIELEEAGQLWWQRK